MFLMNLFGQFDVNQNCSILAAKCIILSNQHCTVFNGPKFYKGSNSIKKYGPIGTLSMGFLILYLTPDLDNIMHEYCYWTKCRSILVTSLPYKCCTHTRIPAHLPTHVNICIYVNIYIYNY